MAAKKQPKKKRKHAPHTTYIRVACSKNLKWLLPYIKRAKKHMTKLILPKRIRSHRPVLSRNHLSWGSCDMANKVITLATHKTIISKNKKRKIKRHVAVSNKDILMTLAHEMAHFRYEKHGYEQESYARTIFHAMGVMEICPHCEGKGEVLAKYKHE